MLERLGTTVGLEARLILPLLLLCHFTSWKSETFSQASPAPCSDPLRRAQLSPVPGNCNFLLQISGSVCEMRPGKSLCGAGGHAQYTPLGLTEVGPLGDGSGRWGRMQSAPPPAPAARTCPPLSSGTVSSLASRCDHTQTEVSLHSRWVLT